MISATLPRQAERGVILIALTAVGFGFTYADQAALIPLLGSELGLSDVQSGLLPTALFVAYIGATLVTSGLPDRYGPNRVIGAGLVLSVAGTAVLAIAPSFATLLLGKSVQGIASALAFVAATRYIVGLYGSTLPHFGLGVYGAGFPLGSALALVATPALATALGGWRGSYLGESVAVAAVSGLWLAAPRVAGARREGSMLDALRCTNCWLVSLQHAAGFGMAIASGSWIAVYLIREFGLPLVGSGLLGSILLLLAVLTRPLGGLAVSRRIARTVAVMRLGDMAVIAGSGLLALPGRPLGVALAGAVALGIGVGLPYAPVFNTAGASLPRAPAAAQGLAAVGGTAGVMVGAPLMGYAVQTWGFAAAWLFVAGIATSALLATLAMRGEEDLLATALRGGGDRAHREDRLR